MPAFDLAPHPRLYIGSEHIARLRRQPNIDLLRRSAERVAAEAESFVNTRQPEWTADSHNQLLRRARAANTRVLTLIVRWLMTGDRRFRDAAVDQVRQIGRWQYWSWIAWRAGDDSPDAVFDLSYGENSATLAMAYDLLHDDLSADERDELVAIARRWTVSAFLRHTTGKELSWWFGHASNNWNTVCCGGAGLVALAMAERLGRDALTILARVEKSIAPFFAALDATDGGWPEGIGYWGYGFRYGLTYLLSHERATGRRHPLLDKPAVRRTLSFPLDFSPNGVPASFGDANGFAPQPIQYAAAERFGLHDLIGRLDNRVARTGLAGSWPTDAELLLLHPRRPFRAAAKRNVVKLYRGLDWAFLADRMPEPTMYLSIRGGRTGVSHGHHDLMSFHCVLGDEAMIVNTGPGEYLDTTFSQRRAELPEVRPDHKNTILVNGVGIVAHSKVATSQLMIGRCPGIRIDATKAMGMSREDLPAVRFAGRLLLMLPGVGFLIVDRVQTKFVARMESRMHTRATVARLADGAILRGQKNILRVSYASDGPGRLFTAVMAPSSPPDDGPTILRWCSGEQLVNEATFATLLSPGRSAARVAIGRPGGKIRVGVTLGRQNSWKKFTITLTDRLRPA